MRLSSGPGRENGYPASSASEQPKNEDRARCVILDCRLARRGFDFAYGVRPFLDPDRITGRDRPTGGSFGKLSRTRIRIDPGNPRSLPAGRVDYGVLDGTTERDIALQQREDDDEAASATGNREQGKRCPTGAARALLKVLDKAPEGSAGVGLGRRP